MSVTLPSEPSVVASVTVPPATERFVPAPFFSCTVIVVVEAPFAVIEVGDADTVDCASDAAAVVVTDCAETEPSALPARSLTFCAVVRPPGPYATVTVSPSKTRFASVRTTCVASGVETELTVSPEPFALTVNALPGVVEPVSSPVPASVSVSVTCVPAASTAEEEYAGATLSKTKV